MGGVVTTKNYGLIPDRAKDFFLLQSAQTGSDDHSLLFSGYWGLFPHMPSWHAQGL
jgi:hypothetical protein